MAPFFFPLHPPSLLTLAPPLHLSFQPPWALHTAVWNLPLLESLCVVLFSYQHKCYPCCIAKGAPASLAHLPWLAAEEHATNDHPSVHTAGRSMGRG